MSRRDMILNETKPAELDGVDVSKLKKVREEGGIYLALIDSPGWKHLMANFLERQISQERYLTANVEELTDIRAEQRVLFNLLQFVNKKVENGSKAFETLKNKA